MSSFPYGNRLQNPFFERSFHEIADEFCSKIIKKGVEKKSEQTHTQTDKQTDRIQPILSISGHGFWTVQTQIPVANASKTRPQNDLRIPFNIPFKEHLRLASVVALSASGACGTIKMPLNIQIGSLGAENDQFCYQIPSGFFLVQNRPFRCIAEARHGFQ